MGTKTNPGTFDCYANAAPDEPMFVLLARDEHAPVLVRLWTLLRQRDGEDDDKIAEALQCAVGMERWHKDNGRIGLTEEASGLVERIYIEATEGLPEHPEGFECSCQCDLCKSYA